MCSMKTEKLIDFHLHTTGSDGKTSPEELVKREIEAGVSFMCFTDHLPFPQNAFKIGKNFHNKNYLKEIEQVKKKYSKNIDISFGAEADWLEGYEEWAKENLKLKKYDYLIGSVHFLKIDKEFFAIDHTKESWIESAKKLGGKHELIKKYYTQLRAMISSGLFDTVGHFDLIKIYNKDALLFSEDSESYKKEVIETLNLVAKNKMSLEINTSGFRKTIGIQYPAVWILKQARKRNISITIGSDAHAPEHIAKNLEKAIKIAKEVRYNSICIFKNRKKAEIEI